MKLANSVGVSASSLADKGLRAMPSIVSAGRAWRYGPRAKDSHPQLLGSSARRWSYPCNSCPPETGRPGRRMTSGSAGKRSQVLENLVSA
jgi:hypothetical protein